MTKEHRKPVEPLTIPLAEPIQQGSETISELVLQPLRGRYYRTIPTELGPDELLTLGGKLTGIPDSTIDKLGAEDAARLLGVVQNAIAVVVRPERAQELQALVAGGGEIPKPHAPVTITLVEPVRIHEADRSEREVSEVTLGKLTARALRVLPPGTAGLGPKDALALAECLIREATPGFSTAMVRELVDLMNPADLAEVVELAEGFMLYVQVGIARP